MQVSEELKQKVEKYYKNNIELKNKLLSGDAEAIRQMGIWAQKGISPEDVVEVYETDNIDYLYRQAKKKMELREVYNELCKAYALHSSSERDDSIEERL